MKQRIVILGGGFAGITTAQHLERLFGPDEAEITLLSRENFSLFTPMLPEVSSGEIDVRHIVTPVRAQLHRTEFILGDVTRIDAARKTVEYVHILSDERGEIACDQLVVALGSVISTFGLPGVAERVFALKTLEDAAILRNRFMWLLELADSTQDEEERRRLLTIVVVGGGFTGVEATGEMVELFTDASRFFPNVKPGDVRVVLVEGGAALLAGLPEKMGTYSQRDLTRRGVEVVLGDPVRGASDDGLELQSGRTIETRTIVWSAGVRVSPVVQACDVPHTKRGAIIVEGDLTVPGFPGVWALGDCASIPDGEGGQYPQTAQHALREAPLLAKNIAATVRGTQLKPFHYDALGMMASLGGRKAVAQLPGDRVLTGFAAWFLWRSYYLMRLPGLERKLRVAFDWTLELLFPRDISELRVYSSRAQSSAAVDAGIRPPAGNSTTHKP